MATIVRSPTHGIDLIEISGGTYEAPAMSGGCQRAAKSIHRDARGLLP